MKSFLPIVLMLVTAAAFAQGDDATDSLMPDSGFDGLSDLLNREMKKSLLEAQQAAKQKAGNGIQSGKPESRGAARPEVLFNSGNSEDQDIEKAREILEAHGLLPDDSKPQKKPQQDLWRGVPAERRLNLAKERLERNEASEALLEIDRVLQTENLDLKLLKEAIPLRIKALFQSGRYEHCQDTYLRYKAYFPDEPGVAELKKYLEKESGLKAFQERVLKNPDDMEMQRKLVRTYEYFKWNDFALRFFEEAFPKPNTAVCETLAALYYDRKDYRKLANVSERAHELDPKTPRHLYNQAVGLYHLKDPISLDRARELLMQARELSTDRAEIERIDWYIMRIPSN